MSLTTTIEQLATRNVEKHNKWAKRQTRVVFSGLEENDTRNLMLAWATECIQQFAENNAAANDSLAHRIREMLENLAVDQVDADSTLGELVMGALNAVSWREIANYYLDAVEISAVR